MDTTTVRDNSDKELSKYFLMYELSVTSQTIVSDISKHKLNKTD